MRYFEDKCFTVIKVCKTQTKQKKNPDRLALTGLQKKKKILDISTKTKKWEDDDTTKELCFVIFVTNPNGPNIKDDKMLHFHINWFSYRLHASSSIMLLATATFLVVISTSILLLEL